MSECCKKLDRIRVIKNTTVDYVKSKDGYKEDKEVSETITVLCGECFLMVPVGRRLTKVLKGLSQRKGLG